MRNFKMTIEYDGSRYKGWQRQTSSDMTIQGKLENLLSKMTSEKIEVNGSGRTDAGVHAVNQIANFTTNSDMSIEDILHYCYKYLPDDIIVKELEECEDAFHARYGAKGKKYVYKINNNIFHSVFDRKFSWHISEKLNINKMKECSEIFVGEHDFKSFTTMKSKKKSTVRRIYSINITEENGYLNIEVIGKGFMRNMVRILVGTLVEVGLGKLTKDEIISIMKNMERSEKCPTAPAEGLFLQEVYY